MQNRQLGLIMGLVVACGLAGYCFGTGYIRVGTPGLTPNVRPATEPDAPAARDNTPSLIDLSGCLPNPRQITHNHASDLVLAVVSDLRSTSSTARSFPTSSTRH